MEQIGEKGVLRSLLNFYGKSERDWRVKNRSAGSQLAVNLDQLFVNHNVDSDLLHPKDYLAEDAGRQALFVRPSVLETEWVRLLCVAPLLSFLPRDLFLEDVTAKTSAAYKRSYGESPAQEQRRLQGEMAMTHPRANKGFQVLTEDIKHLANVGTWSVGAGLAGVAYHLLPALLSYPLMAGSAASALVMALNAIRSRGHNSDGVVASLLAGKLNRLA